MVKKKIYLDTCLLIDLLKEEAELSVEKSIKSKNFYTNELIKSSEEGRIELYTSYITVCECTHVEPGQVNLKKELQDFCDNLFFNEKRIIRLINISLNIIKEARSLRWNHSLKIRTPDMIHLASALYIKCDEFITFDRKILNLDTNKDFVNLEIVEPNKSIIFSDKNSKQKEFF